MDVLQQYYDYMMERLPVQLKNPKCMKNGQIQEQRMFQSFKKSSIGVYPHPAHRNTPLHQHDFFELIYIHEGDCINIIDDKEIFLKKGDLCLLNTHAVHTIRCKHPENTIIFNLLVGQSVLESAHFKLLSYNDFVANFFLTSLQKKRIKNNYLVFHQSPNADNYVNLCQQIIIEYYENDGALYQESKLIHLFDCLLIELARNYQQQYNIPLDNKNSSSCKISEVIEYMGEHCDTITLHSLAEHFSYHPKYFGRIIQQATGQNFSELLLQLRMNRAKILLENSKLPITEIMYQVGYHNYAWFKNQFQKQYGKSPTEYRGKYIAGSQ